MRFLVLLLLAGTFLLPQTGRAAWGFFHKGKRKDYQSFDAGVRLMTHYNHVRVISTPPETMLIEGHYTYWYQGWVGGYLTYGQSFSGASTNLVGLGVRLPFLSFFHSANATGRFQLMLIADFIRYSTAAPVAPESYPETSYVFRGGAGAQLNIGNTRFFLQGSMMVSQISDNFFIAPYAGIGLNF